MERTEYPMQRIIVTGVDGYFGRIVAEKIQSFVPAERLVFTAPRAQGLEAFADSGIDTAVTNFNNPDGLTEVFAGADKLLLISMPFVGEKRRAAHQNAVDAAVAAGVGEIVYTSFFYEHVPINEGIYMIVQARIL